ncbi:MAG TPA: zinc finger domain-containing protein, partial [Gammaproteobacteria bacterium]|nr:zinc finger domain-containing protein [Gammaproteobacteria bacterium]
GAANESVFLQTWYEGLVGDFNSRAIDAARDVNVHLRKELEEMRRDKVIGSSLDAEVDIYCDDEKYQALQELGNELRFVFITSDARIHSLADKPNEANDIDQSLAIMVNKSGYQKCVRCWHHREEIGEHDIHKELCERCIENVAGEGELRVFA